MTAAQAALVSCPTCRLVSRVPHRLIKGHAICLRCGAKLSLRKPNSLARTWALIVAAYILYIPANVYPVMTVISFGKGEPDTILSGVQSLIASGWWPLAVLVFFASIIVPLIKLVGLTYLVASVQYRWHWHPKQRTILYRITEAVGRWSMIDIFMITILVALVRLEAIATVEPGAGATSFAAVVVLTMFAAMSFDPRLMWDVVDQRHDQRA
ncbi:MAG: paraquat-inducible protein A [Nitrospirota bacterium]|nr:paraquat-inducible protein A [Nitrospirota bacterium]MDH5587188.1 paraquat-inducible protein A [Nitrospirota bacterium]MDH5776469.1 paraquat-inducible protein A [Nitrospirota bacterium]